MAQRVASTAEKYGADVRLRHVAETAPREAVESVDAWREHAAEMEGQPTADPEDLAWADVVLMGSPTRYGHVTSQLQSFIDQLGPLWQEGKLADKAYAAFTSSQTLHGGQESTILAMLTTFCHLGGIIVPPGYTDQSKFDDGNPYGVSVVADADGLDDTARTALDHLVTRVLDVAQRLAA